MKAELLHVIVVHNNPLRWQSRARNYQQVEKRLLQVGVQLTTVECAYGERPFELEGHPQINRVRVRTNDILWHKENLGRIGFSRIPDPDWRYAATLDGDTWFADDNWAAETVHQLQLYPVVQLSSDLVFLGPKGEHISKGTSLAHLHLKHCWYREPQACMSGPWGYPGLGWGYRRNAYDALGGLLDICILGSGDYHMARALLGLPEPTGRVNGTNPMYARHIDRWRTRAAETIKGDVGVVPGTALHLWHGSYKNRAYETRPSILVRHQFDPDTDITRDSQGVIVWTGTKPKLRDDVRAYFSSRNEDSIEL